MLFNPQTAPFAEGFLHSAQTAAQSLGAVMAGAPCTSPADIENAFAETARQPGGGIIAIIDTFLTEHRDLLVDLATRYRLPAVYGVRAIARAAGSWPTRPTIPTFSTVPRPMWTASCNGTRPGDLPVQEPAKFTLSVNLKAATAIGLTLPQSLIIRADEVIE